MLHTQYVFVYGDTCILVINFAPPKVKSWLRHCLTCMLFALAHWQLWYIVLAPGVVRILLCSCQTGKSN